MYKLTLAAIFVAYWTWAAINPHLRHNWFLENCLVLLFVPIIVGTGIYFRLSNISYTLITLFLLLHVTGSHWGYNDVPFGFTLGKWLGTGRNMFDRVVHFSFGFLLAYPIREVFVRITRARGFWGYYLPLDVILALSAIYELIEWGAAANLGDATSLAFVGSQGDIWDAQKDMFMAGIGATIAMTIVLIINARLDKAFWTEFKQSFKIPKDDRPLGETRLDELLHP